MSKNYSEAVRAAKAAYKKGEKAVDAAWDHADKLETRLLDKLDQDMAAAKKLLK